MKHGFGTREYAHIHMEHLSKLVKHDLVIGLPNMKFIKYKLYYGCQKGKQTKITLKPKNVGAISRSLQMIHMDLFDPSRTRSYKGNVTVFLNIFGHYFEESMHITLMNLSPPMRIRLCVMLWVLCY